MKKLLLILSFASLTIIANAQWQQTSLDTGYISCIAVSGNNIFVGMRANSGIGQGMFLSTNNGTTWTAINTGLTGNALWVPALAINGSNIYAGTYDGVYLSDNNGTTWTAMNTGLTMDALYISSLAINGTEIFAGTNGSGIGISTNNAASWTLSYTGLPYNSSIWQYDNILSLVITGTNIFAGTDRDGVYLSTNNGSSWAAVNTGLPTGVSVYSLAVSNTNIFAGTWGGAGAYLSTNNGASWTATGVFMGYINSFAINGTNIFAGTDSNGVYLSTNNGASWTAVNTGLPSHDIFALAINGSYIFAGVDSVDIHGNTLGYGVWKRPLSDFVGINEINENNRMAFYPNPAKDKLTIESPQKSTIDVLNIQGQIIIQQTVRQGKTDIDISELAKGVYILRLCSNDKTEVSRIVKE